MRATSWCAPAKASIEPPPRPRSTRCARAWPAARISPRVAKENSEDVNTAAEGGDLGWFARTPTARNSARRSRRCRTARSPSRSRPRPAGTSCSAIGTRQANVERPDPARADAREHRPAQARGRVEPLPARDAWRSLRRHPCSARARPSRQSPPRRHRRPPAAADVSRPRLALVPGEPAGVGPELCVRAAQREWDADLVVFGDGGSLQGAAAALGLPLALTSAARIAAPGDVALVDDSQRAPPRSATPIRATPPA